MKRNLLTLALMSIGLVQSPLNAHEEHGREAPPANHATPALESLSEAWSAIQSASDSIGRLIAAKNLKGIHAEAERLSPATKVLQEKSTMLDAEKKKRIESSLKQLGNLAHSLHDAADQGNQAKTEAEFNKLKGILKLIEAQYPADVLKSKPTAAFTCPMHPEVVSDKPGKCPTCGMDLVTKADTTQNGGVSSGPVAHADHNPRRGGAFSMSGDHHLEAVLVGDEFRVFFYDAFTRPVKANHFSGALVVAASEQGSREKKILLKAGPKDEYLYAPRPEGHPEQEVTFELFVDGRDQLFGFPIFKAEDIHCRQCQTKTSVGNSPALCWNCSGNLKQVNSGVECSKCAEKPAKTPNSATGKAG